MGKDGPTRGDRVHVAAFGKHPGWDDHIEEIGLDCAPLVQAKRVLYSEGMSGNIDAGAWERLSDEQRLPAFKHTFYWRVPEGLIVGRVWSSRDGKGRTKYPMIVCAFVEGAPASWSIAQIPARLAAVEAKCTGTNSAELVRLAIGEARRSLENEHEVLMSGGGPTVTTDDAELMRRLVDHPDLSPGGQAGVGLTRVLYEIDRELSAFRPATGASRLTRSNMESGGAQHLRVPRCLGEGGEACRAWLALLGQELSDGAPVLVFEPAGEGFLDIVVGVPKPAQLFCVRASPKGLALTSDVPYSIDASFTTQAAARIADWRAGKVRTRERAAPAAPAPGESPRASRKAPLAVALGIGAGAIVLAAILYVLTRGDSGDGPAPSPTPDRDTTRPDREESPGATDRPSTDRGAPDRPASEQPREPSRPEVPPANVTTQAPVRAPIPVAEPAPTYPEGDPRTGWGFVEWAKAAGDALRVVEREAADAGQAVDPSLRERLERVIDREAKFIRTAEVTQGTRAAIVRDMASVEREVKDILAAAESAQGALAARLRTDLEARGANMPVTTEPMRAAWRRGVGAIDARAGRRTAFEALEALGASLRDAEREVLAVSLAAPALKAGNMGAIEAQATARRDAALEAAANAALTGQRERVVGVTTDLAGWASTRRAFLERATECERLLDLGAGPGERVGDGPTLATMLGELRQAPLWRELGAALGPLASRIDELEALERMRDPGPLREAIRAAAADQSRVRASEALTAWRALGAAGWPASREDLGAATTLAPGVEAAAARAADPARAERLRGEARAVGRAMWGAWMKAHATDDDAIRAGMEAKGPLAVGQADVDALPGWTRFNVARHALAEAVQRASGQSGAARDAAQRQAMDAFVRATEGLPEAAALLGAIAPLRSPGAQLDLSALGPGGAGWRMTRAEGDAVVYEWQHEGRTHRQEFRRVEAAAGDDVGFVATTEVSVGLFADLVNAAGRWDAMRGTGGAAGLLPSSEVGGQDPRRGPRGWVWVGDKIEPSTAPAGDTSKGWLRPTSRMANQPYYPEGLTVEPPSRAMPMQQVPVKAAALAARLAGCRLPTAAEWTAAAAGGPGWSNRRDATWLKQFEHVRGLGGTLDPDFPSANIFRAQATRVQPADDGEAAIATDDGVLWFVHADEGEPSAAGFRNLIGNVSEFLFEDAAALQASPATREAVEGLIANGERVRVIGGSALSPAEVRTEAPEAIRRVQVNSAFSDVGFRLAFSAPRAAGAAGAGDRLKAALAEHGYLGKP